LNQASPGRAPRHGGTRPQRSRPSGPARLGSPRHGVIQTKLSQSSSSRRYSRTLPASSRTASAEYSTLIGRQKYLSRWECPAISHRFFGTRPPTAQAWVNLMQGHNLIFKAQQPCSGGHWGPDTVRSPTSSGTSANATGDQERAKVYHVHRRFASSAPSHCQRVS
jgi:hypothetical protein